MHRLWAVAFYIVFKLFAFKINGDNEAHLKDEDLLYTGGLLCRFDWT